MVSFKLFSYNKITRLKNGSNIDGIDTKCRERLSCLARCVLVYINSLVLLCAFLLLGFGAAPPNWCGPVFVWRNTIDATLISLGLIIGIIAFFGFFGALQENVCMLMMYAATLMIMFIVHAAYYIFHVAVVYRLIQSKTVVENVLWFLYENVEFFVFHIIIDTIQSILHCCGIQGPQSIAFDYFGNETVISSCCIDGSYPCPIEHAFKQSCVSEVDNYFPQILDVTLTIVLLLGALQIIFATMAFFITYVVKGRIIKYGRIPDVSSISDK